MHARPPAVAGTFYPGVRAELERVVRGYLSEADPRPGAPPKAIIAPHAGYVYSGPVAASAYAALEPMRARIERVVLLGPSHRVGFRGLAAPSAESFLTPLGEIPIDREALDAALRLPQVAVADEAHALEHSLEVHLPFLQMALDHFALAPFSVGDASPEEVAAVLEALWGGPETLIVVSSDLSHYYDYETARSMDAKTAEAIERLDPDGLHRESACGRVPVRGLLALAQRKRLSVETVDLRSSGDTAGSRDQVVGYGSWLFREADAKPRAVSEPEVAAFDPDECDEWDEGLDAALLDVARRSIEHGASQAAPLSVSAPAHPPALRLVRATFVTLRREGELRGCIGSLEPRRPLVCDVAENAFRAAFRDPRFQPVAAEEIPRLEVHVSILGPTEPLRFESEEDLIALLRPGVDGLVLVERGRRGTFLPDVWESLPDPRAFLRRLKEKAGLPADHWSQSVEVLRYTTRSVG